MEFTGTRNPCGLARVKEEGLPASGASQSAEGEVMGVGLRDQVGGGSTAGVHSTPDVEKQPGTA